MTTTRPTHRRRRCRAHPTATTPRYRPRACAASRTSNAVPALPDSVARGVEWLTPNQTATYLQVPVRQLQQWRYLRKGPPYSLAGRAVRYRRADLDAWLIAHRVEPDREVT